MQTLDLVYEAFGDPSSRPLVILPGFFASSRNWRLLAQKLAGKRRVYVLDMRNHGLSPHHPIMDYPVMAADVSAFMAKHGLAKASLLGHSMGGKVAMWLALETPQLIDKLVVVDIAPIGYRYGFDSLIAALKALPLAELNSRKQAEEFLSEAIPDLAYRQFLLQNLLLREGCYQWRINLDFFQIAAPFIVAFPNTHGLTAYPGEALFIAGADSGYVKAEDVNPLFPNALLRYIANAGHWLHVQQPEVFVRQVEAFLDSP